MNLKRDALSVSSEGYIINKISDYMEQFGMVEKRISGNELCYYNVDILKSFIVPRRKQIQNISFTVEITDSAIIITIVNSIIYAFAIMIMSIFLPFIFLPFTEAVFIPAGGIAFYFLSYFMRLHVLLHFKSDIQDLMKNLKN